MRERVPEAVIKETLDLAKNQFTIDVTLFAEPDPDAEAAEADENEEA